MIDTPEASQEFRDLEERLRAGGLTPEEQARWEELRALQGEPAAEEPTGVLWERGPVETPADPFPEPSIGRSGPPPLPPPDPSFAAVVVEDPEEEIPEVSAEDVEEVLESPDAPAAVAAVSWIDEEGPGGEVVSLDALLATPPPASAESLAPPLPPPLPPHVAPAAPVDAPEPVTGPPAADPFSPSPSFVSGEHRVVLHTVEGQVMRGMLANADLADAELPLLQPNGAVARVPATHLKAVFFMLPAGERPPAAAGTRVRVTFGDGRQVAGLSPEYAPESAGFFVLPVDTRTNTARVWVYRGAVQHITIG
jgi:hypothetical protein